MSPLANLIYGNPRINSALMSAASLFAFYWQGSPGL
jgi:hypothetical protein